MPALIWDRDVGQDISNARNTFSSWDSCMSQAYCKVRILSLTCSRNTHRLILPTVARNRRHSNRKHHSHKRNLVLCSLLVLRRRMLLCLLFVLQQMLPFATTEQPRIPATARTTLPAISKPPAADVWRSWRSLWRVSRSANGDV